MGPYRESRMNTRRATRGYSFSFALTLALIVGLVGAIPVGADQFVHPFYVAVDNGGNIYVTEPERDRVQKFDFSGGFVTQWGTFGSGDGQFNGPRGIAVDSAYNVYVADNQNSRIQKFTNTGVFVTKWTVPGTPGAPVQRPIAVAVDTSGRVYVTGSSPPRVQVFNGAGAPLLSWGGGQTGIGDGQFSPTLEPRGIAVDAAGFVYVSDTGNHRVQKFAPTGAFVGWVGRCSGGPYCDNPNQRSGGFQCTAVTCSAAGSGSGDGQFLLPEGVTVDAAGNLYVVDSSNHRIQVFYATGEFKTKWGMLGVAVGQLRSPTGAASAGAGNIIVADTGNNRIQMFDAGGTVTRVWGPDVRVTSSRGETPGNVNPITVGPSSSTQSTITVESVNWFGGPVNLTVLCCQDWATSVGPAPSGVTVTLSSNSVTVPANGSATAILEVAATSVPAAGKYIATVNASNPGLGISRDVYVVFTVNSAQGANFFLDHNAPGTGLVPDLSPPKTAAFKLYVVSDKFAGPVALRASCCFDVITQRTLPVPGVAFALSPDRVYFTGIGMPPGGYELQTPTLTISTSGAPFFGKLLVPVTATSPALGITRTTNVEFIELPKSEPAPSCRPGTEVIPLGPIVQTLVTGKERDPTKSKFLIGVKIPGTSGAFLWTIEEDSSLTADEATIVLDNSQLRSRIKEITTVGCSSAGKKILVGRTVFAGLTDSMKITKADSTIILRELVCTFQFIGCWSSSFRDVAVFAEPAFWRVFGGKKNTFLWLAD